MTGKIPTKKRQAGVGWMVVLLCVLTLTGGCRRRQSSDLTVAVRLINAVPDAAALSVAVDGRQVWRRSPYRNNTGFKGISEGDYDVRVSVPGATVPLASVRPLAFRKDRRYTVVALGLVNDAVSPAAVRVFEDARDARIPADKARLRFLNAAPGTGAVDLLINNIVGLKKTPFGSRSEALFLSGATYDLKVNETGGFVTPLIGPVSLRLEPGRGYTIVAMGRRDAGSLTLEVYPDSP